MYFAWILAQVLYIFAGIGSAQKVCKGKDTDTCKCDLVDGNGVIDISFGKKDNTSLYDKIEDSDGSTYAYNPCYPFAKENITGLAVLQYDDKNYYDIGQQSGSNWQKDENGSLFVVYRSLTTLEYTSTVELICNKDAKSNQLTALGLENTGVNYNFVFSGPSLCAIGSESNGLSGGSIFLIIISVFIFVYLVGGILFKKVVTDETGTDLIPNKDFWTSLPGLVKDGFMFLACKCKRQPSGADYDSI